MSGALHLAPAQANSGSKTMLPPVTAHWWRKSRSRIPRSKRRIHIPWFADDDDALEKGVGAEAKAVAEHSAAEADSSSSSCFHSVVTDDSSLIPFRSENARKRGREGGWRSVGSEALRGSSYAGEFRRITRLYARQIENRKLAEEKEAECSGNRGSDSALADVESSRRRSIRGRGTEDGGGEKAAAVECAGSELTVSEMSHVSGGDVRKKARSCVKLVSEAEVPEILKSPDASQNFGGAGQLACSEQLSSGGAGQSSASVYSNCNEVLLSELESELFGGSSEDYLSDQSHLLESSDNFSEKSRDDTRTSVAFFLYLEFTKEFSPSSLPEAPPEHPDEFTLLRFESVEDEESYNLFRIRERRIQLYDYSEEKTITPEYYEMVIHERIVMINWMVEHSNAVELRNETLFLGVSLMDRFLCRGFFKTRRSLHLLGIACVALATRLEENQPYNNVRRNTYFVGEHAYSRGEVVGMEWLVQEVLNFQCFLPTTYNFLWFYLKAARAEPKVESLAKYLAVLSLLDHDRLRFWPSTVAAGIVVLASLAADSDDSCRWVMETHVRTKNDDLPECIKSLEWLIKHVP